MKENKQEQLIKAAEKLFKDNKVTAGKLWYDVIFCVKMSEIKPKYYKNLN